MAFESYNAQDIWSSGEAPGATSNLAAAGKLALAAGAGLGGFHALMHSRADGTRPLDQVAGFARTAGNLTPFQLGNTFRVPEFLFPFTSPAYQKLEGGQHIFDKEFLGNPETTSYLQKITGKSYKELHALGLSQEAMIGADGASSLVYKAGRGAQGSLHVNRGGVQTLLSNAVSLMSAESEIDPLKREAGLGINKAMRGVMQALDLWGKEGFDEKKFWTNTKGERSGLVPVPSITGPMKTREDLLRRSTIFRGISAFEVSRFNDLMGGYAHQIFGESGAKFSQTVLGIGNEVRPGPASALLTRYAGRAALLGGAALVVSQTDWARRQGGLVGQAGAAGVTTGAGAYMAWKMGVSNKLVMMGSVASFFGQMVLPGFDKGLVEGAAATGAGLDVTRASALNPFGYYRRTLEGFAPGSTDWKTGAFLGLGAMAASAMRIPGTGKRISEHLVEKLGPAKLGLTRGVLEVAPDELLSTRDMFWRNIEKDADALGLGSDKWRTITGRKDLYSALKEKLGGHSQASASMNVRWRQAEDMHRTMMQKSFEGGINKDLLGGLERVATKYNNGNWFERNIAMQAEGFAQQAYHSFFGADAAYDRTMRAEVSKLGFQSMTPVGKLGRLGTLGLAVFGAHQLLTGGALGSLESSEDLRDIYAGRKDVEVKKSRGWESGSQEYGGGETSYFRPHQIALMLNRTREQGVWGANEDETSPISKFLRKNFTYELEEKNYYDRPYPISGAAFQDVPIIGGLLASTVGRLIKPPKLMHTEEWAREGAGGEAEFKSIYKGSRQEPAYALGAQGPGTPVSPFGVSEQFKFLSFQSRQLSGFPGWLRNTIQGVVTGDNSFAHNQPVLANAGEMDSASRRFWDANVGGAFFASELWRRILPHKQSGIDTVNPIRNSQPSWMPDKFHTGDKYAELEWGEARLPGPGYAANHRELTGVDPEEYPILARMAILGDVAPTSVEYRRIQEQVYQKRQEGGFTPEQEAYIDQKDSQVSQQVNQKSFDRQDLRAITLPGSSLTQDVWAGGLSALRHVAAPVEYLTPMGFRPTQKLLSDYRDPIESYEQERLYGTQLAFWDKPMRDWFRPAAYSAAHMMGFDGKPGWRREADAVDQRFDEIEFQKWMKLAMSAEAAGDIKAKNQYMWAASNTRTGINPQGSAMSIYWALPESERSYFNSFSMAQGNERERILEMVPGDQAHLYQAIWSRMDNGDQSVVAGEGLGVDENFLKAKFYQQPTSDMPPEDWIGFNSEVDISDVKVRYAEKYASDIADYGIWESQVKKSESQDFLDGSESYIGSPGTIAASQIRSKMWNMSGSALNRPHLSVFGSDRGSRVRMNYNDHRDTDMATAYQKALTGGY